jgi:hypothetical protein
MPVTPQSTPSTSLLTPTVSQAARLTADIARRVAVNLHKCSRHVALAENVQREMRPYMKHEPDYLIADLLYTGSETQGRAAVISNIEFDWLGRFWVTSRRVV